LVGLTKKENTHQGPGTLPGLFFSLESLAKPASGQRGIVMERAR